MAPTKKQTDLRPVVFCGPSGVGKGTLIDLLMKRFPNEQFGFSVSHTTRKPREGEVDGVHYNFTTVESIQKEIKEGKFIEYAEVHGRYYGTRYVDEPIPGDCAASRLNRTDSLTVSQCRCRRVCQVAGQDLRAGH